MTYKVGIVYSRTGLLAAYGAEYIQGLRYGIQYATGGTNKVNGKTINLTLVDDKTDPATGVSAMKDLIGQGFKIIAGATSSGVALQEAPIAAQNQVLFISGPAATDAITGLNRYTFRSGRQTYQDVADGGDLPAARRPGKKVLVFAQDSAFGQGNFAAVKPIFGGKGHNVSSLYVPLSATDFTPFAQQAKQAEARTCSTSPGPAPPPRRCGRRSTSRASSRGRQRRHRTRRAGDLPELRPARSGRSTSSRTTSTRRRTTR